MKFNVDRGSRSAFTLIEVLTTIGVLMVLVGLTWPVFASARASARQAKCLSNMRQLAQGLRLYGEEDTAYRHTFFTPSKWTTGSPLEPLVCPDYVNVPFAAYEPMKNRGYAINSCLLGGGAVSSESEVILLAESACVRVVEDDGTPTTLCREQLAVPDSLMRDPQFWPIEGALSLAPVGKFGAERHAGRGHYAFVDTHVKLLHASQIGRPAHTMQCDEAFPEWVGPRSGPRFAPFPLNWSVPTGIRTSHKENLP
ncbi:MAG: hypothetical protein AMXMBFR81_06620 [Chthonomonas sp.]